MLKMDITIKPVHAVTSIKQSRELKGHLFSSPDPKGHVRYCHHLASDVRPLTFSYFNLLL